MCVCVCVCVCAGSEEEWYTVHVKAQVMTRDDSSGGWVPLGGGGVSVVGVRCTAPPSPHRRHRPATYSIYGCRLNDNSARYSSYSVKDRAGAVLAHPPHFGATGER